MEIVSRAAWGANPLHTPASSIATPTPDLWLHHTASTGLHGASGMRSLQQGALAGGYVDLEYSFVVDNPTPTVFESRGPGRNTAATGGSTDGVANNARSSAICVMGNFEVQAPSLEVVDMIAELVAYGHARGWWGPSITGPHKAAPGNATACCGANLIAHIAEINRRASSSSGSSGPPSSSKGGAVEIVTTPSGNGYYVVDSTGAVFAYGDAKYFGGANDEKLNAPIVGMTVRPQNDGYWLLAGDGGVFAYGKAPFKGAPTGKVH